MNLIAFVRRRPFWGRALPLAVILFTAVLLVGLVSAQGQENAEQAGQSSQAKPKYLEELKNPIVKPENINPTVESPLILSQDGGEETDPIIRIYGDYPSTADNLGSKMGDRRAPDYQDPKGKVVAFEVLKNGDVLFGPNIGIVRRPLDKDDPDTPLATDHQHTSPIDFFWDAQSRRLNVRSIIMTENGDPADLAFRRSGDNTYPYGPPQGIDKGTNLGTIYWQGWGADDSGFDDRAAQIYATAAENITKDASGGTLHFSTTSVGTTARIDRLVIGSEGNVGVGTTMPEAKLQVAGEGASLAVDYPASGELETGDVVMIDENAQQLSVVKAKGPYDRKLVGVAAANSTVRISQQAAPDPETGQNEGDAVVVEPGYPIAHAGRVAVKVSASNGAIRPGDYLTSSTIPGVAMKATEAGPVVGKALESYDEGTVGQIQMLVDVTWYHP